MENFVTAMRIDPEYLAAQVNLAKVLTRQGKLDAGIDVFSRILEKYPDRYDAQLEIALALMRQRRFDEATAHFRAALKLDPDPAGASTNLVNFLLADMRQAWMRRSRSPATASSLSPIPPPPI